MESSGQINCPFFPPHSFFCGTKLNASSFTAIADVKAIILKENEDSHFPLENVEELFAATEFGRSTPSVSLSAYINLSARLCAHEEHILAGSFLKHGVEHFINNDPEFGVLIFEGLLNLGTILMIAEGGDSAGRNYLNSIVTYEECKNNKNVSPALSNLKEEAERLLKVYG